MKKPINTTTEVQRDPLSFLAAAMCGGTGRAIEEQESQGQRQFVSSDTLPMRMGKEDQAALEACGFKFIGQVEGDHLFQYVEMPDGWKKVGTDHPMWSDLVDAQGRRRAGIFYKAAFYDRDAFLNLIIRYAVGIDHNESYDHNNLVARVWDGKTIIFSTQSIPRPDLFMDREHITEALLAEAKTWLAERFPDYQNPAAYWD